MSPFDRLVDRWLDEHWDLHPVSATLNGVPGRDGTLGDFTAESFEARAARDRRWLEELSALADEDLSPAERIDRDLLISHHRGNEILHDFAEWRRSADGYVSAGLSGLFALFLRRPVPDPELVGLAASRLAEIPGVLACARANLDPALAAAPLVRRSVGQCRAGVRWCRDLLPAEVGDPDLRSRLAEAAAPAADAYEEMAAWLEDFADRCTGTWVLGADRYTALLTEREQLTFDVGELAERGRWAWAELAEQIGEVAARIDPDATWVEVVERLKDDHPATPEDALGMYAAWCERARDFLLAEDLVTMPPGEVCEVVPQPHFQRPVLSVASYIRPPAFRSSLVGRFNVPFPPDGATEAEIRARLRDNARPLAPSITVHEAYPGHHWHLATVTWRARPLRRVVTTPYFVEGWGLYAEKMMDDHGFFDTDPVRLGFLHARIFRAARIVVDTGLHTGEMGFDEAVDHMVRHAALSPEVARAEVLRYCAWPTQAAAYLTGSLEIERMAGEFCAGGSRSLKDFHDHLGASGGMPIGLAERALWQAHADPA